MSFNYNTFTSRNLPIISHSDQNKISNSNILIAGCGLGSLIAESLARMGFQNFSLVDHDLIELHNLNRQSYQYKHIGNEKVSALKEVILGINPQSVITSHIEFLNEKNVDSLVSSCDVIIDTIDFLDLKSVILLHDKANYYKKIIISVFAAAWGCVAVVIPPRTSQAYLRDLFAVHETNLDNLSYTEKFAAFFTKLAPHLNSEVKDIMVNVFSRMHDHQPCPASVVITGAQCASIVCEKLLFDYIKNGMPTKTEFYYLDLTKVINNTKIDLDR